MTSVTNDAAVWKSLDRVDNLLHGMTNEEVAPEALQLFRALSVAMRAELLRNAVVHSVASGTVLFEQGDVPTFQLIVLAGSVQLFGRSADDREVLIEAVRAQDLVIPAAVLTGAPYLMQARVPEPSRILLVHAAAFRAAVETNPLLAQAVITSLAQQFRRMVRQIKNLKLRTAVQRVGCYLLALSQRQRTPDKAVLPFEKMLIASELGITRESFSRALSSLSNSGIRVHGQTVVIHDARRLAAECGFDPVTDRPDTDDFVV